MAAAVHVEGLAEMNRAFARLDRDIKTKKTGELKKLVEPPRSAAEDNALSNISNIGSVWSGMRVGTSTSLVYIAPKARRRGGSPRGNLAGLLMDAMQSAVDEHQEQIVEGLEHWLSKLESEAGF